MLESISYEQVLATSQALKSSSNRMKQILDEVNQKMNKVGSGEVWESDAAQQFLTEFRKLAAKFDLFYTTIDNYSKFLNNTVETYKAADQAIAGKAEELL